MKRVAFLRPQLGIGGSERLVLDAATELQRRGDRVRFYVADDGSGPQFAEVRERRVDVTSAGTWLPSTIAGRVRAPLAILRTAAAAARLVRDRDTHDLVFCDVVAHLIPWLQRRSGLPVLYYCHFPDLLLTAAGARASTAYSGYRWPLDRQEIASLRAADRLAVNSRFTESIVRRHFPELAAAHIDVVHPGVPVPAAPPLLPDDPHGPIQLLSISRFDPRKNLPLAVDALAALRARVAAAAFARVRLVMSGHFDERLAEQHELVDALSARAEALGVRSHLEFAFSPSEAERDALLAASRAVIYTPAAEHFGYVPLEAMAARRPVVAVNHGGPRETVVDGVTGRLCAATAAAFADGIAGFVTDATLARTFGQAGHDHVRRAFSIAAFGQRVTDVLESMLLTRTARASNRRS